MSGNTFGRLFRLTTYGESHGLGLGGVVEGCPAGMGLIEDDIQAALDARKPGGRREAAGTPRMELDRVRLLSGVFKGLTTGTPIAFYVENQNQRAGDYEKLSDYLRPGHADLGYHAKYDIRDYRGGGRASGRETLSRVAGGAIAAKFLETLGITVQACTKELGGIAAEIKDLDQAATRPYFCPDSHTAAKWESCCQDARRQGDSLGGLVYLRINGVPAGLGEPVFDKLEARLAYALMGVGSVTGMQIGRGFAAARVKGSENNDPFLPGNSEEADFIKARGRLPSGASYGFASNNAGGVLGGISSGAPVVALVSVKPISSISKEQNSIDLEGAPVTFCIDGRHDVSAIPRIVPVLKAMAALAVADFVLLQQSAQLEYFSHGVFAPEGESKKE
jgi:chorismate synthase